MLRHCTKTLARKKTKRYESEEAAAEYNLGIEGFLMGSGKPFGVLHTKHCWNTDLRLNASEVWLGKRLDEKEYAELRDKALAFNDNYSEKFNDGTTLDCHQLISKFLQHCTAERYEQAVVGWDIEKMTAQIEPILAEFEKRFQAAASAAVKVWSSTI